MCVRPIEEIRAWSPTRENLLRFCDEMTGRLSVPMEPVADARSAVQGADIVVTMTKAREPVLLGDWLEPGMHLNAAGSKLGSNREVDARAVSRADLILVDDLAQSRVESGDLIAAVKEGTIRWEAITELGSVIAGDKPGHEKPEDITLFESHGIGIWDIALATRVYDAAVQQGLGTELPIEAGPDPRRHDIICACGECLPQYEDRVYICQHDQRASDGSRIAFDEEGHHTRLHSGQGSRRRRR